MMLVTAICCFYYALKDKRVAYLTGVTTKPDNIFQYGRDFEGTKNDYSYGARTDDYC